MMHDVGPPLASESSGYLPATRSSYDETTPRPTRGVSAHSHRQLSYTTTAQWAFLASTQPLNSRRLTRPIQPARPATARESASFGCTQIPKRPSASRRIKSQISQHEHSELLAPRTATVAIQEAIQRERGQEHYSDPLIGRSVEPRGQLTRERKTSDELEANTIALLSRARVVTTAAMNATERLRLRAFQARANGEYDRAIKFYTRLLAAKPKEIEAKFHLAVCLERTGQFTHALAAYKQVQKLSSKQHALAYHNMGNLCMRAEKVPQAIDYFSRAIAASKDKGVALTGDNTQSSSSAVEVTPIVFYRQRAAAYRKNGDFEKAAKDYVLIQRCAGTEPSVALPEENAIYTAENLYQTVKRAASPRKSVLPTGAGDDRNNMSTELKVNKGGQNQHEINESQLENVKDAEDPLTTWALRRSVAIARISPLKRSESNLECLVDFMQKRFSICAALHPDVCKILCRELLLSSEDTLPAKTPIFFEQEEDIGTAQNDRAIYFILHGRVSISKTAGKMFQSSSCRPEQTEEFPEHEEIEEGKYDDAWETPWNIRRSPVSSSWKQSQLELCELEHGEVFGHQGRYTDSPR
ncbi:unnamed protein product [Phytophthora lilii]|uniref:Unnamed protein product n=1 Tax=Phytophthora lilii TaxID=2077276 RepID=A0A9W7DA40_9STRA|nr:unnamed protein product [Phytophthora lilii]